MTQATVTESPMDTLADAAARMWHEQTGSLLVMDGPTMVGIVTERDVLKAVARGMSLDVPVSEVMTRDVVTVEPSMLLFEAAALMSTRWIRHLPVVDGGQVIGLVSQRDLVGVFAALRSEPAISGVPNAELVREHRLARIGHGDLD
jgi:signal-transduction protein with cAMP-binding, CBS, and nucleotidyltransferase domain